MPRSEVIGRLRGNVELTGKLSQELSWQEAARLRREVRGYVKEQGKDLLPSAIRAKSEDRLDVATKMGILVTETDPEYNRALVRESLLNVKVRLAWLNTIEPLNERAARRLRENIHALRDGMQESMMRQLNEHYSEEQVADFMDQTERRWLDLLGPYNSRFRKPLSDQEVAHLVAEFDRRLPASIDRIPRRRTSAEGVDDPRAEREFMEVVKRSILQELAHKAFRIFTARVADPALAARSAEEFVPAYPEAVQQRVAIQRRLVAERREQIRKQQQ